MKKAVCVLFTVLFLSGIAYGQNAAALSGKYYLSSMELEGYTLDAEMMALIGMKPDDCYIEFMANGKCVMRMDDDIGGGTFKVEGRTLTITDDEGTADKGVIDGNKVSIENDEVKMIFEKR